MNLSTIDWTAAGLFLTIITAVSTLTWWLSGQFSSVRNLVHAKVDLVEKSILDKLEYHERHDDQRFTTIDNSLWEMKLRNAAIRGVISNTKGPVTSVVKELQDHFETVE